MPVKFQRESMDDFLADAYKIVHVALEEASDIPGDRLNMDWDGYTALELQGFLHLITGRNEKNELVAYWLGTIGPHGQHKHVIASFDHAYWVRPDYRGITVLRLFKFLEQYYEEHKVERSYHFARPHKHSLGGILEIIGYRPEDVIYVKVR